MPSPVQSRGSRKTNPHLFPEIASQIQSGATRIEVGNLTPRRNYVHAADVATLVITALQRQWNGFDVVNIGSEEEYSVLEVLEKFRKLAPTPVEFVSSPARQRPVDRPRLQPELEKMRRLLGDATRTVDDAIRDLLTERAATLHAA